MIQDSQKINQLKFLVNIKFGIDIQSKFNSDSNLWQWYVNIDGYTSHSYAIFNTELEMYERLLAVQTDD